jgi:hypothetical protein
MQWRHGRFWWQLGFLALVLGAWPRAAKAENTALDQAVAAELRVLASHAGAIFVGQITSIDRKQGVVEVAFRVDQGVAGAQRSSCVLREWAGLWPPGHFRYTVGQRVLAFLLPASSAEFSTPVHAAEGLVPVIVQGPGAPQLLDIRRVAASVVRASGTPLPTEADAAILLSDALALIKSSGAAQASIPAHRLLPTRGAAPEGPGGGNMQSPVVHPIHEIPTAPAVKEVRGAFR